MKLVERKYVLGDDAKALKGKGVRGLMYKKGTRNLAGLERIDSVIAKVELFNGSQSLIKIVTKSGHYRILSPSYFPWCRKSFELKGKHDLEIDI